MSDHKNSQEENQTSQTLTTTETAPETNPISKAPTNADGDIPVKEMESPKNEPLAQAMIEENETENKPDAIVDEEKNDGKISPNEEIMISEKCEGTIEKSVTMDEVAFVEDDEALGNNNVQTKELDSSFEADNKIDNHLSPQNEQESENIKSVINREENDGEDITVEADVDKNKISELKNSEGTAEEDEEEIASSEEDETTDEEEEEKDYSSLSQQELVEELDKLLKNNKVQQIKNEVEAIRSEFNTKFNEDLENKKEEFLTEGGNVIDFQYSTPLKKDFSSLYFDYKEKRNNHYKSLKRDLNANLEKRQEIIEELKGLWNNEENINTTYNHFKDIQQRWREAGAIPRDKYNLVWNNYHHHVENFYDYLHLNREFRDLDFKHNLEQKLKIIGRAEELAQEDDINKAFRELQMLHKMWKEDVGPVAKEYRDDVWDKFSEATRHIHDKRQEQQEQLEKQFEQNYELKKELVSQIQEITTTTKPSHNAWQSSIKKVQQLRDIYFKTGRVPRANNKEIWADFKKTTSEFNHAKNNFYKKQKQEQYDNLEKKLALIKVADENKNSDDFDAVTPVMKKIQAEWKAIGHVPRKDSDKIWNVFKKSCNHYFERIHAQKNEANKEELESYENKKTLLDQLKTFELSGNHKDDLAAIKKNITAWKDTGRVPYNKRQITQQFNQTLDGLFEKLDLGKKETELIKFENKLNTLVNQEDQRKLQNEHFFISKKIDETKDEIRQLENNLGFFHHVDENNPLVKEVHKNIDRHKEQLEVWQAKLSKIKVARED